MQEIIINALADMPKELATFLMAMLPVTELRAAIPVAIIKYNMSPWLAFAYAVLGNAIMGALILLLIEPITKIIIERAGEILSELENKRLEGKTKTSEIVKTISKRAPEALQLSIFETVDPMAGQLKQAILNLDLNTMTPIECMLKIRELKNLLES